MKLTIFLLAISLCLGLTGFSQKNKDMTPKPLKTLMNKGKNNLIQYKTLEIDPTNLYVQDRPFNDRSTHIQLELNSKEGDKNFHTFLWYFEKGRDPLTNYPQVFGKYLYSLEIGVEDAVTFVVEEVNFEKQFYLNLGDEANIGKLTVKFSGSIDAMGASSDGRVHGNESYAEYELLLSENKEEKKISFTSLNANSQKPQSFKWKNYEIKVLYDDLKILKLVVFQTAADKK